MVTYHYVKIYVSIIIQLEVININVRNFEFPIGFYSNPHPLWTLKNIQHCPISSQFDMWVDNDVPNWFPTLKNFYRSPFSKWPPQYRTNSTLSDFNINVRNFEFPIGFYSNPHPLWTLKNMALTPFTTNLKTLGSTRNIYLAQFQHCSISTSWIDSQHQKISIGLHFQNGHHNTAKIQHCSISKVAFN
jgi:hypothetical protein